MDSEIFFRVATAVALLSGAVIGSYYRGRAERLGGALPSRAGQGPLLVLRVVGLLMWLPIVAYIIDPGLVAWATLPLPTEVRLAALGLGLIDTGLVVWMYRALGLNVSAVHEVRTGATLVTHGPYRWIRHPLYTFGFLMFAALALMTGLVVWVGVAGLVFAAFVLWRVPREEARLIEVFGDDYRAYMRRTGRFLPKLSRYESSRSTG